MELAWMILNFRILHATRGDEQPEVVNCPEIAFDLRNWDSPTAWSHWNLLWVLRNRISTGPTISGQLEWIEGSWPEADARGSADGCGPLVTRPTLNSGSCTRRLSQHCHSAPICFVTMHASWNYTMEWQIYPVKIGQIKTQHDSVSIKLISSSLLYLKVAALFTRLLDMNCPDQSEELRCTSLGA